MIRSRLKPRLATLALAAMLPSALLAPRAAHAWWRGGFFVGIPGPIVIAPPVFAPPPVVYAPPVGYGSYGPPPGYGSFSSQSGGPQSYGPPPGSGALPRPRRGTAPSYAGQPSRMCFAGTISCPLDPQFPRGAGCSCPADGGLAYGRSG